MVAERTNLAPNGSAAAGNLAATPEAPGRYLDLLETRFNAAQEKKDRLAFDPSIIIAILAALLPLLKDCVNPTPRNLRSRFGNRFRLAAALRRELPRASWADCYEYADDLFGLADAATDAELTGLIATVRS